MFTNVAIEFQTVIVINFSANMQNLGEEGDGVINPNGGKTKVCYCLQYQHKHQVRYCTIQEMQYQFNLYIDQVRYFNTEDGNKMLLCAILTHQISYCSVEGMSVLLCAILTLLCAILTQ